MNAEPQAAVTSTQLRIVMRIVFIVSTVMHEGHSNFFQSQSLLSNKLKLPIDQISLVAPLEKPDGLKNLAYWNAQLEGALGG